ncbi:MAG: bifunctional riboflavin kinase/FAD synthetase [Gaiellales bacterium]
MTERQVRTLHQGIDEVPPGRRSIALGTFDGVHLGHRAVIAAAKAAGDRLGVSTMAATFHPRPATVIRPGTPSASLSGITERIRMLYQAGADEVVMMRFTAQLAELSAQEFVEQVLVDRFGAVAIAVGEDFRFGHDRRGGVEAMRGLCEPFGIEVDAVELLADDGEKISSSRIRGLISEGAMPEAAELLGRLPSVDGVVAHGDKRGREIGFPTANLSVVPGQQLPAEGVYAGWATINPGEQRYAAAISVGRNPHFGDVDDLRIEAHLLNYDGGEIYDRPLRLDFLSLVRGQGVYEDLEALIAQITADVEEVRRRTSAAA